MKGFFDGIGQWAATFRCQKLTPGQVVKFAAGGQAVSCDADDQFCGSVISVGRDGSACSVALGGIVSASFSGKTAPAIGWCSLAADGNGGVSASESGLPFRVVDVDSTHNLVTFVL